MGLKFKLGFGKAEVTKAVKGAGVAGGGAVLATALSEVGLLPDARFAPPVGPYVVAALAVGVNLVRQLIRDNTGGE